MKAQDKKRTLEIRKLREELDSSAYVNLREKKYS